MINTKMKSEKGITMVSLVITTIVLILLANAIIYNARDGLRLGKLENMQNDIENLRDKISSYYAQNGKIPVYLEYTNINDIKKAGAISDAVDTGKFFVIDLSAFENLTLNYGRDYENVKSLDSLTEDQSKENTDLYIINETSHNIFYVAGITMDNETYYTDNTLDSIDTVPVDLRYVDGVKIPDGYSYVEGNKETGIVIKNDTNNKTYTWIVVNETLTKVPNDVVVDDNEKSKFLDSVNRLKGYYRNNNDDTVIYIEVTESWSPEYDTVGIYKDKNGDTAYIPEGFRVSNKPGETLIDEGLVVQGADGSEFVWVPVSEITSMATAISGTDSNGRINYQGKLYDFSGTTSAEMKNYGQGTIYYREPSLITGNSDDTYASMSSISGTSYDASSNYYSTILGYSSAMAFGNVMQEDYNEMVESVIKYGGFYIGKYETSLHEETVASIKGKIPMDATSSSGNMWYGIYQKEKEYASKNNLTSISSSMIWGSQYDAMLNWVLTGNDKERIAETTNGNHSNSVVNTGETTTDKINNIYDLEGNLEEWTLEATSDSSRAKRGGCINSNNSISYRYYTLPNNYLSTCGSRITLYIK